MSYGGDRYDSGGRGGESGGYYNAGDQSDANPRRGDRVDEYAGGRESGGRQEGGFGGSAGRREDFDRVPGGFDQSNAGRYGSGGGDDTDRPARQGGGYGRNDDSERISGGQGGYGAGGNDRFDDRPARDEDYDRRFNQGSGGRDDDRHGGSAGGYGGRQDEGRFGGGQSEGRLGGSGGGYGGGQSEGRYGEQGKPYAGPQSGVESTPYDAPQSGYDGPHRPQQSGGGRPPLNDEVTGHADNQEDKSLFSQALSFLNNKGDGDDDNVDEGKMQKHHDNAYSGNPSGNLDSNSLGAAAALHAFQSFTGGSQTQASAGGQGGQGQLLGMVFKEASKLFDQQNSQGNVQGGVDKQSVLNAAGKQAIKLYLGQSSGGGGGLMGLASKFLK